MYERMPTPLKPQTVLTGTTPSPVASWLFHPDRIRDGQLVAVTGPNLHLSGFPQAKDGGMEMEGPWDCATYPWNRWAQWADFPKEAFTIDLYLRLNRMDPAMGLAGCIFATGDGLRGWTLNGENGDAVFYVATEQGIVSVRARNLPSRKFVALTACYDQKQVRLYVDGKRAARRTRRIRLI